MVNLIGRLLNLHFIRPCICQKILVFRKSRKSKVENCRRSKLVRYKTPVFKCPKLSQNLPNLLPKIRFKTPVRKYTGIFENYENSSINLLFSLLPVTYVQNRHTQKVVKTQKAIYLDPCAC